MSINYDCPVIQAARQEARREALEEAAKICANRAKEHELSRAAVVYEDSLENERVDLIASSKMYEAQDCKAEIYALLDKEVLHDRA